MERRRHDAPCAGALTLEPHRTARPARRARARRLPRPNLTRFRITTDYASQDVSAAAEKRARWNCRWHPTTASPMDDCCSLLLAALARAGRAGAHSSVSVSAHASLLSDVRLDPSVLPAPRCWLLPPCSLISASTRLSCQLHLVLEVARLFQPSPVSPWQVPKVAVLPRWWRAKKPRGDGRRRKEEAMVVGWRLS